MELFYAPLEGICYPEYRVLHHRLFPGVDSYYAPFLAPGGGGYKPDFVRKKLWDVEKGVPLVPQLMANDPHKFLAAARIMADLGFREVNLNAGCPSGTVFSKHKGAGMLQDTDSLQSFLDTVYRYSPIAVSIKTRLGVCKSEEFERILEIYSRYPVPLLIIHPRVREDYYKGAPRTESYAFALRNTGLSLCYNGNIFSPAALERLSEQVSLPDKIMLGRGAVANPALFRLLRGEKPLSVTEFTEFHDSLLDSYLSLCLGDTGTIRRMKELWFYMGCLFPDCPKELKTLLRSVTLSDYRASVRSLLNTGRFNGTGSFVQP